MTKRLLVVFLKYGLGIAVLAFVLHQNWESPPGSTSPGLRDALSRPLQIVPMCFAIVICFFSVLLTFLRWYVLVCAQELPFTVGDSIRLGLVSYFFSTFLPGSVGGDLVKAAFLAKEQSRRTVAVATVLVDRAVGLWGLFCLVAASGTVFWLLDDPGLLSNRYLQLILVTAWAVSLGTAFVWVIARFLPPERAEQLTQLLLRIPKLGGSAAEFWRAMWMYLRKGKGVALALALAFVGHIGFVLTYYFSVRIFIEPSNLGQIPTLAQHFLLVPAGMIFQAFFPSPGGVGGGELGFGALYEIVGKSKADAVLGSLAQRLISVGLGLIGYIVYLQMKPALRERRAEKGPESVSPNGEPSTQRREDAETLGEQGGA